MVQRLTYRRRHSYASKSNTQRIVKTPGGKLVYQLAKKKTSHPTCPISGQRLHGLPAVRPSSLHRVNKSKKTVHRAYGGHLAAGVVKERIVRAFLVEEQKIVKKVGREGRRPVCSGGGRRCRESELSRPLQRGLRPAPAAWTTGLSSWRCPASECKRGLQHAAGARSTSEGQRMLHSTRQRRCSTPGQAARHRSRQQQPALRGSAARQRRQRQLTEAASAAAAAAHQLQQIQMQICSPISGLWKPGRPTLWSLHSMAHMPALRDMALANAQQQQQQQQQQYVMRWRHAGSCGFQGSSKCRQRASKHVTFSSALARITSAGSAC